MHVVQQFQYFLFSYILEGTSATLFNIPEQMSRQLSAPSDIKHEKLYERKPFNGEKNGQTNIANGTVSGNKVSTKRLLGIYFDPPKPDTPPLNVSLFRKIGRWPQSQ